MVIRITGISDLADVAEEYGKAILTSPTSTPVVTAFGRIGSSLMSTYRRDVDAAANQHTALAGSRDVELSWIFGFPAGRLLGLLAHTVGRVDEAATHFEDCLIFCRRGGFKPALGWTCSDYAEALLQSNGRGDSQRAASLLDEALAISTQLGMAPLMERVAALRERAEAQPLRVPAYPRRLTQREGEVLFQLSQGKTTREIAKELVLSERTVQRHIANLYAKINVRNRAEATTFALSQQAPPTPTIPTA